MTTSKDVSAAADGVLTVPAGGAGGSDAVGHVETRGIDYIPEAERHSAPKNLFWVWFGTQMTFGIIIIGWLPIVFGLSWWGAFTAITIGMIAGSFFHAAFSLLGPWTGTNSAVSSGAHFGVVGRVVGSLLAFFGAVGYGAITVWISGDVVVYSLHSLFGTSESNGAKAISYGIILAVMIAVSIYGHANVVAVQKLAAPVVLVLLIVGVIILAPRFDAQYAGGEYLLGSFWPTWLLSFVVAAQLPISYCSLSGDYSRYISFRRYSKRSVALAAGLGMFFGCWLAVLFAAFTATMFPLDVHSYAEGLITISPKWYIAAVLLVGLLGSFAQGVVALYGTGLDFSSLVPRLPRVPATISISVVLLAIVYIGAFLTSGALEMITAFTILLAVMIMPWIVVTLIGMWACRGRYYPLDLQVFNARATGGAYWYTRGVSVKAALTFIIAAGLGLLFVQTPPMYVGPLANIAGGVDISMFVSAGVAAVLYGILITVSPERNHRPAHDEALRSPVPISQH
ncbi:purine-cytosine permease family protein [Mycolicibacterium sp.]|uniref:purine-cytosine permease family protein n=1 Tax=Mycolicibacterium sp. TaxID=2320850 RepID=UPI003D0B4494